MQKFQKVVTTILLVALVATFGITLASCNSGRQNPISPNMLDGLRLVLPTDATHLGIIRNNPHQLVSLDDYGVQRLVRFAPVDVTIDDEIEQATIDAEFEKLYVTQYFIYFTMTSRVVVRPIQGECDEFDRVNFRSDDTTQTFLVDRVNKHIYSLSVFTVIEKIVCRVIIVNRESVSSLEGSGKTALLLTTQDNSITYTDLVPNPEISVRDVFVDRGGNIFIDTDMLDTFVPHSIIENVFFIGGARQGQGGFRFALDARGDFYKMQLSPWSIIAVQVFLNGMWKAPVLSDGHIFIECVLFHPRKKIVLTETCSIQIGSQGFVAEHLVEGHVLYTRSHHSSFVSDFQVSSNTFLFGNHSEYVVRQCTSGGVYIFYWQYHSIPDSNVLWFTINMPPISTLTSFRDYLLATHEGIAGQITYRIYIDDNGNIAYTLHDERQFETNIIVLFPLSL